MQPKKPIIQEGTLVIPLFPLTNAVFFPKTLFPLHIFEKRYLQLLEDSLEKEQLIGIILLKKGWHRNYFGAPDMYDVGTVGKIKEYHKLPDGTYNVILEGLYRFKIMRETQNTPYRLAEVKPLSAKPLATSAPDIDREKQVLVKVFSEFIQDIDPAELPGRLVNPSLPYDELVNVISQLLDHLMSKKQSLLEEDDIQQRGKKLIGLMKSRITQNKITQLLDDDFEGAFFN